MKKKIAILAAVAAMALTSGLVIKASINEAKANVNPECPNGCKADGDGCVCNGYHQYLREAGNKTGFEELEQY